MMNRSQSMRPGAEHATDRFGVLLLELVALVLLTAFSSISRPVLVIQGVLVLVILITSLRVSGTTPAQMNIALVTAAVMLFVVVIGGSWGSADVSGAISIGVGLLLAVGVVAVIRRIFEHERIGIAQLVGAFAAYIQIAVVFAMVFAGIDQMTDTAFFATGDADTPGVYLYFSVVTVTTLGYGDFSPGTSLGRSLVLVETLLGQIVLVVLVAYLVGSLGRQRPRLRDHERKPPGRGGS